MKLLKTFALIAWIAFLSLSLASAAYWVWSNVVTVTVSAYSFQNSLVVDNLTPIQYRNITFWGTLYKGGMAVGSGFNVTLFKNDVPVAWSLTDAIGHFIITYNVTEIGSMSFDARYKVP